MLNPEDKKRSQFFTRQLQQKALQAKQIMQQIPVQGKIEQIIAEYPHSEIALSILQSLDRVYWQDPFSYKKKSSSTTSFSNWQARQKCWQKQMQQFLNTKQCRWQFILATFGFQEKSLGFKCGNCDRCENNNIV